MLYSILLTILSLRRNMSSNLLRNDSFVLCSTVLTILSARNDLPDDSSLLCSTVLTILSARNLLPDFSSLLCSTVLTILSARKLLPDDSSLLCFHCADGTSATGQTGQRLSPPPSGLSIWLRLRSSDHADNTVAKERHVHGSRDSMLVTAPDS